MRVARDRVTSSIDKVTKQNVTKLALDLHQNLLSGIGRKILREIVKDINEEWKKLATEKLTGFRAKYLSKYLSGMTPAKIEGDRIKIELKTFEAVKIERGWAPPQGSNVTLMDGLGTYDGMAKDLRPLLLHSGRQAHHATDRKTKQGFLWKVIKFDLGKSSSALEESVKGWLEKKTFRFDESYDPSLSPEHAEQLANKFSEALKTTVAAAKKKRDKSKKLTKLRVGISELPDKSLTELPSKKTIIWSETMRSSIEVQHRSHIYKNMRVKAEYRKVSFSTYRTITDKSSDIGAHRWFAEGTPPANIIINDPENNDLMHKIATVLMAKGFKRVLKGTRVTPKRKAVTVNVAPESSAPSAIAAASVGTAANPVVEAVAAKSFFSPVEDEAPEPDPEPYTPARRNKNQVFESKMEKAIAGKFKPRALLGVSVDESAFSSDEKTVNEHFTATRKSESQFSGSGGRSQEDIEMERAMRDFMRQSRKR